MTADRKQPSNIPIRFVDDDESESEADQRVQPALDDSGIIELNESDANLNDSFDDFAVSPAEAIDPGDEAPLGGPEVAELVASRAELKRLQAELVDAKDGAARRQADFENYRKRVDRDRSETHNRIVGDVARKLLPVVDNLTRALDAERSVENRESKEFRHFLHGIELITKQLNDVLESFGVTAVEAVGQRFDPHIHEAVVTEPSDEYEPDMVTEEIARGYKLGDRLLRPSMVKVAARRE